MPFKPKFQITVSIARALMRIEAAKEAIEGLPITPQVMASLRETARLYTTHYSTAIEGNRLTQEQVGRVIGGREHFPGRERDEREVLGYYAALERVERIAAAGGEISEIEIRTLHALVMSRGSGRVKPTPYRDGQNVIRDAGSGRIVYMPPEAKDVPALMRELVEWIAESGKGDLPCPVRAGIAHYQFATIHPYYDGNGRTARLLTTLILHLGGYDLKGIYSLEEYYAQELGAYYRSLSIGPSHNYYIGRADADITEWITYFCGGMAESFEKVRNRAREIARESVKVEPVQMRGLDPRQRRVMEHFINNETITSRDVAQFLGLSQRTARHLLSGWADDGFLTIIDPAKKSRKYGLSQEFRAILIIPS